MFVEIHQREPKKKPPEAGASGAFFGSLPYLDTYAITQIYEKSIFAEFSGKKPFLFTICLQFTCVFTGFYFYLTK